MGFSLVDEDRPLSKADFVWALALATLAFLWTIAPLQGYDFWSYLSVGRIVLEEGSIPWEQSFLGRTEVWAFHKYADQAWLGSTIFYLFYKFLGLPGMIVLRSCLLSLVTTLTYFNCRLIGLQAKWAFLWSILGLWTIRSRFLSRSYLFTDLCAAALVLLVVWHWKSQRTKPFLIGIVCLFSLWSNLHQGVLAGLILLIPWTILNGHSLRLGMSTYFLACLGVMLRPHGFQYPQFIYDHFSSQTAITGVAEWAALDLKTWLQHLGPGTAIALVLVFMGVKRIIQDKPENPPPWSFLIITGMFFFAAIRSGRSVSEILPIVFPLSAAYFPQLKAPKRLFGLATAVMLCLLFVSFPNYRWERLSDNSHRYPIALLQHIETEHHQVLNSFEYGNFLAFQGTPPFLHGVTSLYKEELLKDYQSILRTEDGYEEKLDRYQVNSCLLHFPTELDATESLVNKLFDSPDWQLKSWDDQALLFVRAPAAEGLNACRPWREPRWLETDEAERELLQIVKQQPSARAYTILSELAGKRADWKKAGDFARLATQENPNYYLAWMSLGLSAAKSGDLATVLESSAEGVRIAPNVSKAHFNRGLALLTLSQAESGLFSWWAKIRCQYHLKRALSLDPGFQPAQQILDNL